MTAQLAATSLRIRASKLCKHCRSKIRVVWYEREDGRVLPVCRVCADARRSVRR